MVSTGGHHGRTRSLDAEVNLVPFIDLLSMCICFLLMTAVWIQISALDVKQSHGNQSKATVLPYDIEFKFMGPTSFEIKLQSAGKIIKKGVFEAVDVGLLSSQVENTLKSWPIWNNEKKTLISSAMITPAVGVSYEKLISVIDVFRRNQIINLGVVPVRGNR